MSTPEGPVLIELDDTAGTTPSPADAPPVPDPDAPPADAAAMQRMARLAAGPRRPLARWFWGLLASLLGLALVAALWAALDAMLARSPVLMTLFGALLASFVLVCGLLLLREIAAFARLGRIDALQRRAVAALADRDLDAARAVGTELAAFYRDRPELTLGRDAVTARLPEAFDADAALAVAETRLLAPLDRQACEAVEAATRQVATVTALVPLALADVVAALTANTRMIRTVAEIYGGRSGTLGTWRLLRAVLTHLVATGAVAVGDDMIHSVAGGSLLGRVSRRFGEGVVNGALTARVGVAAMEVCRPLPFAAAPRPSVTGLVRRALSGLFGQRDSDAVQSDAGT